MYSFYNFLNFFLLIFFTVINQTLWVCLINVKAQSRTFYCCLYSLQFCTDFSSQFYHKPWTQRMFVLVRFLIWGWKHLIVQKKPNAAVSQTECEIIDRRHLHDLYLLININVLSQSITRGKNRMNTTGYKVAQKEKRNNTFTGFYCFMDENRKTPTRKTKTLLKVLESTCGWEPLAS